MNPGGRYRPTNVYDIGRFRAWLNTTAEARSISDEARQGIARHGLVGHARRQARCSTYDLGQLKRLHRYPFVLIERSLSFPEPGPVEWVHARGYRTREEAEEFAARLPCSRAVVLPTTKPPAVVPPGENVEAHTLVAVEHALRAVSGRREP